MQDMQYYFPDTANGVQKKILDLDLASHWSPFKEIKELDRSYSKSDLTELKHIIFPLAYGETTATHGFGDRIANTSEGILKLWLSTHLLDETRHTIAFSKYLENLGYIPEEMETFPYRHVKVFYGRTDRLKDIFDWLFATTTAEIFGQYLYKDLAKRLPDQMSQHFFDLIVNDESRHIGFLRSYLAEQVKRGNLKVTDTYTNNWQKIISSARRMFETDKKGSCYGACRYFDINISNSCDIAESELEKFINQLKAFQ